MLLLEELIIDSDGDLEIGSSIVAGFDDEKNFVIELDYTDYAESGHGRKTKAIVEKEDAWILAERLNVSLTSLPQEMNKRFGVKSNTVVPTEVESLFSEMLDFLLGCDVYYRLKG